MAKAAKSASSDMIPAWVIRWFWITTLIVSWDASYALLHPWSRDVTDPISSVIYAPYQQTYQFVDLFYGSDAAFAKAGLGINAFGPTQSVMNIFEIIMGVVFLYLASINHGAARPLGLVTATMTCSKTIIYFIVSQKMLLSPLVAHTSNTFSPPPPLCPTTTNN